MTEPQYDRLGNRQFWFKELHDNFKTDSERYYMSLGFRQRQHLACSCSPRTIEYYSDVSKAAPLVTFCGKCYLPTPKSLPKIILRCDTCKEPYVPRPTDYPIRELDCGSHSSEVSPPAGRTPRKFRIIG